jgi:hypothetical protein
MTDITVVVESFVATTSLSIVSGVWTPSTKLAEPYRSGVATLLPNGMVLLSATSGESLEYRFRSQIYDPLTDQWSSTGLYAGGYEGSAATLLPNGKVLFVGGRPTTGTFTSEATLYDPVGRTRAVTGSMSVQRSYSQTLTLLPNGKVLVVGGIVREMIAPNIYRAELFDPLTGTWSQTGDNVVQRIGHTATLLPLGNVLVAGGCYFGTGCPVAASAELYDPNSGTWALTGSLIAARMAHTATLLPNGKVLVVGGFEPSANTHVSFASAELFDPATGTWSPTGALQTARRYHSATLLPDGKVLVAGGIGSGSEDPVLASAELYDPVSGAWSPTSNLAMASSEHSALLLPNGKTLVTKPLPELYW